VTVKVIHRETCRLCDAKDVELVVKLEPIPLAENYCADSETGSKTSSQPGRENVGAQHAAPLPHRTAGSADVTSELVA